MRWSEEKQCLEFIGDMPSHIPMRTLYEERLETENAILREALERIISVADAYTGKGQLVANQGQAMDGYSALYNFVGEADNAKQALQRAGGGVKL